MNHVETAQELRDNPERHYNCCQAVLVPFARETNLDADTACRLADHFGSGMRRASACGAVTGGLMALGVMGKSGEETARAYQKAFQERAEGIDCADLLRNATQKGEVRRAHCDRMVRIAVELVDEFTAE